MAPTYIWLAVFLAISVAGIGRVHAGETQGGETGSTERPKLTCFVCSELNDCLNRMRNESCAESERACATFFETTAQQYVAGKQCMAGVERPHCARHPATQRWGCYCMSNYCNHANVQHALPTVDQLMLNLFCVQVLSLTLASMTSSDGARILRQLD